MKFFSRFLSRAFGSVRTEIDQSPALQVHFMQDLLSYGVHDLRNPMTTILMSADLLDRFIEDGHRDEEAKQTIEGLRLSLGQMNLILEHMLDTATHSIESPIHLEPELILLRHYITGVVQQVSIAASLAGTRVVNDVPEGLTVVGDPAWLARVLQNLLMNALNHSAGQTILITARETEFSGVEICVADDGVGMSRPLIERLERETPNPSLRHGLGLHAAKTILEAHGGQLWIKSGEGEGTTVGIDLPSSRGLIL